MSNLEKKPVKSRARTRLRGERVTVALPVTLDGAKGKTRNVSADGIFIEIDAAYEVGSGVGFTVELMVDGKKIILKAQGEIVRIEDREHRRGVAVSIRESVMAVAEYIAGFSKSGKFRVYYAIRTLTLDGL